MNLQECLLLHSFCDWENSMAELMELAINGTLMRDLELIYEQ